MYWVYVFLDYEITLSIGLRDSVSWCYDNLVIFRDNAEWNLEMYLMRLRDKV